MKVGISQNGQLKATDMTMAETGIVNDVNFYSHAAKGNVRLAIYDDAAPRNKLWESGSVANSVAGGFVTVPISSGTPSSLTLGAGSYQLAWQVNTNADVPSYALGSANEGLAIERPYGALPADLNSLAPVNSTERWTMYINYTVPTPSPTASPTPSETPSPTGSPTASETPSATASPTPSPSVSPTSSPTPSSTSSPTPSETETPTPSPTASSTPSPTGTPTPFGSPSPTGTLTPTVTPIASPTSTPTGTPSPSPNSAGRWELYE